MEADFWHNKWARNEIAFHEGRPNPLLTKHFRALTLTKGSRVFVPLCGKTVDMAWLLAEGYHVVGAELSEIAIQQLFEELNLDPVVTALPDFTLYQGPSLEIFVGDIFKLTASQVAEVEGVYDRAALVALPYEMRVKYTKHLTALTAAAPQLLITFDYDQSLIDGPPFSIPTVELQQHYGATYKVTALETVTVPGGVRQQCPAEEKAWLLRA